MKRPSAINTKVHKDDSELLATTAPSSSQTFLEEPVSPSNHNEGISDSDSISESRLRKKRSTYQKIPDDIRIDLLEAVQNGETLKAAAKRHKINYSSAKSILHTYRKEGRILKKSAQERTIKRKGDTVLDYEQDPKPVKQCKKENMQPTDAKASKSINSSEKKKPLAQSSTDNTANNNKLGTKKNQSSTQVEDSKPVTEASKTTQKEVSNNVAVEQRDTSEVNHTGSLDHVHHNTTKVKPYDSFHGNYMNGSLSEAGDHIMGDRHDISNHMYGSRDFDPYNDLMHSLHNKSHPNDDMHHNANPFAFSQVFGHPDGLGDRVGRKDSFDDFHLDNFAYCPLKSFMDTQNLFREALRKASFFSNGGNTSGIRKDSIDFFKM